MGTTRLLLADFHNDQHAMSFICFAKAEQPAKPGDLGIGDKG